jgi:tetratricopeptide (TPR) repeat protein
LGESDPFRRSSSMGFSPATGSELTEALEVYKSVLEGYEGPNLDSHKETFNSLALRVDLLSENLQRPDSPTSSTGNFAADLELAVEIYQQALAAQNEIIDSLPVDPNLETSSNIASTLIRMGSLYYKLGNRLEELRMYSEAKDVYVKAFGENHTFVAGARKNIGMVLAERGEYEDAMEEFDKARQIYLAVNNGDETSRDVASAISCMGNVKNRMSELDGALTYYMNALSIYKSIHDNTFDQESIVGRAVGDVTSTLKVIGMVHAKKGDLDSAMGFFTEAMTLLRASKVDSTPTGRETTSSVLTRMASIHVKKGDLDQAMEHYRQAYEMVVHARGSTNHQDVAGILHYIGGILHKRTDYEEAMNCYQEAIRIYHATLGPGNPTVAGTLVMVGSIHYKRRKLDSAMMFYREALRLNRDAYGLHHPDVAPILKSIGTILTKKGDYNEAYDIFRDVLSIKSTIYGTGHPEVASAYKSLGNVHYKLGELADAERQYRHALSIYRRTRGNEHPDTIAARTTIEHIRYWMKERGQRRSEERHTRNSSRTRPDDDERSC